MKALLSLFEDQTQIKITFERKPTFAFLGKELDNRILQQVCSLVSPTHPQFFFLSSERFRDISQSKLELLQNFTIFINQQAFRCNSIFASCLSQNIFELLLFDSTLDQIYWNDPSLDQILISLFHLLLGFPFFSFQFDPYLLYRAYILVGFHSTETQIGNPRSFEETVLFLSHSYCFDFPNQFIFSVHLVAQEFTSVTSKIFSEMLTKSIE
jgi:hypothetical protein